VNDERRQFQRLILTQPLDGWFGDFAVQLLDVSATGALIETEEPIPPDASALLRFYWRGTELEILATTARSSDFLTGLQFNEENERLCELIAECAEELLRAFEANAAGNRDGNTIGEATITAASDVRGSGFRTWILRDGTWSSRISLLADQPEDGFTIPAAEDPEQVALLCRTYESGDTEARKLTRMLAELSIAGAG
jgi:hypothetical protein